MNEEMRRELDYIFGFVNEGGFDQDIACDQLICLWTAFCLRFGLDVDTAEYDRIVLEIWDALTASEEDSAFWGDFDEFDNSMAKYLV